jgi:hypothetical protein
VVSQNFGFSNASNLYNLYQVKNWFQTFAFKWVNLCRYWSAPAAVRRIVALSAFGGGPKKKSGGPGSPGKADPVRNKVWLYTIWNSVVTHSLKAPGFNPKAPGFNPMAFEVKTWFSRLCFFKFHRYRYNSAMWGGALQTLKDKEVLTFEAGRCKS